jgi:hypothetical protein
VFTRSHLQLNPVHAFKVFNPVCAQQSSSSHGSHQHTFFSSSFFTLSLQTTSTFRRFPILDESIDRSISSSSSSSLLCRRSLFLNCHFELCSSSNETVSGLEIELIKGSVDVCLKGSGFYCHNQIERSVNYYRNYYRTNRRPILGSVSSKECRRTARLVRLTSLLSLSLTLTGSVQVHVLNG